MGDARSLEAELLAHAAWMRRLARRLCDGDADADDALQDARVAALADGARGRSPRDGRRWLARVLQNAAGRIGRAEGRRGRRERAAARPEAVPSAADCAADAELSRALVAALLRLEEPYLSTLVLRFHRDLDPARIAAIQGVPAGTVRSRLSRGLERLRRDLDARKGGRATWTAGLAGLARAGFDRPGGTPGTPRDWNARAASSAHATAAATGGVLMASHAKLALAGAAALAAALAGLHVAREGAAPGLADARLEEDARPPDDATGASADAPGAALAGAEPEADDRAPVAAAGREEPGPPPLRVRAVDPDGAPVAGAELLALPESGPEPVLAHATTDAEGRAALRATDAWPRTVRIAWRASGFATANCSYPVTEEELELVLPPGATIRGVVRDAEGGAPIAGAEVACAGAAATSDERGRFLLEGVPVSAVVIRSRARGYAPLHVPIEVLAPGEHEQDLGLVATTPITVRVVDRESGGPIAGAALLPHSGGKPLGSTGADGRSLVEAVPGEPFTLHAAAEGYVELRWSCDGLVAPGPGAEATLGLAPAGIVEGRVTGPDDAPAPGAFVFATCSLHKGRYGSQREVAREPELAASAIPCGELFDVEPRDAVQTGDDGAFRLSLPACGGEIEVAAAHPRHPTAEVRIVGPAARATVRVELALRPAGAVEGRVTRNGRPWSRRAIHLEDAAGERVALGRTADDGSYRVDRVPPGTWSAVVRAPGGRRLAAEPVVVSAGETAVRDVAWSEPVELLRGRTLAPDGTPLARVRVDAVPRSREHETVVTQSDAAGAFALELVAGERYDLRARTGASSRSVPDVEGGPGERIVILPAPGRLRLRLVDGATGAAPLSLATGSAAVAWGPAGLRPLRAADAAVGVGGVLEADVEAGRVDVVLRLPDAGYAPVRLAGIEVPAGDAMEPFPVELSSGADAHLVLAPGEEVLTGHVVLLLEDAQLDLVEGPLADGDPTATTRWNGVTLRLDDPFLVHQAVSFGDGRAASVRGLAPGRYHLRVVPADVALEPAVLDLPADGPIEVRRRAR